MLKSLEDIQRLVARRFTSSYAKVVASEAVNRRTGAEPALRDADDWPYVIALGHPTKRELVEGIGEAIAYLTAIEDFALKHHLELRFDTRMAGGKQRIATHVLVPGIDEAASVAGAKAIAQLKRARSRAATLAAKFPTCPIDAIAQVITKSGSMDDLDFELLVLAGLWFSANDATGLTPRQVPLEGFHAKWLDGAGRRKLVSLLCDKVDLGLVARPAQVDFAYLDPTYLAEGRRRYDSHLLGDASELPYPPHVVVIVENKDTYLRFPPLDGGICVFGNGQEGAAHVRMLPWISEADRLFYWGDIDASGLEILNGYREGGLAVASILMDIESYRRYERFGTSTATGKQRLADHRRLELGHLGDGERELYDLLVSPDCPGPRRIEQERIPLDHALAAIQIIG